MVPSGNVQRSSSGDDHFFLSLLPRESRHRNTDLWTAIPVSSQHNRCFSTLPEHYRYTKIEDRNDNPNVFLRLFKHKTSELLRQNDGDGGSGNDSCWPTPRVTGNCRRQSTTAIHGDIQSSLAPAVAAIPEQPHNPSSTLLSLIHGDSPAATAAATNKSTSIMGKHALVGAVVPSTTLAPKPASALAAPVPIVTMPAITFRGEKKAAVCSSFDAHRARTVLLTVLNPGLVLQGSGPAIPSAINEPTSPLPPRLLPPLQCLEDARFCETTTVALSGKLPLQGSSAKKEQQSGLTVTPASASSGFLPLPKIRDYVKSRELAPRQRAQKNNQSLFLNGHTTFVGSDKTVTGCRGSRVSRERDGEEDCPSVASTATSIGGYQDSCTDDTGSTSSEVGGDRSSEKVSEKTTAASTAPGFLHSTLLDRSLHQTAEQPELTLKPENPLKPKEAPREQFIRKTVDSSFHGALAADANKKFANPYFMRSPEPFDLPIPFGLWPPSSPQRKP